MFIREKRGAAWAVMALLVGLSASSTAKAQGAAVLPEGVQPQGRSGFYLESQVGVFTGFGGAFGGNRPYSNAQPFMAISGGLDIAAVEGLSAFFTVGFGANAGSCLDADESGLCVEYPGETPSFAVSAFSLIPIEVGARYSFVELAPRLTMHAALAVGYTLITPKVTSSAPGGSVHAGAGIGLDYATHLSGLAVGVEVMARSAFTPMYPSVTAYPRLRYVF